MMNRVVFQIVFLSFKPSAFFSGWQVLSSDEVGKYRIIGFEWLTIIIVNVADKVVRNVFELSDGFSDFEFY